MYCRPRLFLPTRNTRRAQATTRMTRRRKGVRATAARTTNYQPCTSAMTSTKARSSCPSKSPRGTSWRARHLRHSPRSSYRGQYRCGWVSGGSRGPSHGKLRRASTTSTTTEILRPRPQQTQREAAVVQVLGGRPVGGGILGVAGVPCCTIARGEDALCVTPNRTTVQSRGQTWRSSYYLLLWRRATIL